MLSMRTGGQILVNALQLHDTEIAFGVPGESYLAVPDALHDSSIRFIINRHEGGTAFMADAYGKMSGRPGICFATRGPGATNAAIGVCTAFKEIDYRRMFGTTRMHQKRAYPARVSGTELHNTDCAAFARAHGAHGETINATPDFLPVLQKALTHIAATGMPALIEPRYDGNLIAPSTTLEAIRQTSLKDKP